MKKLIVVILSFHYAIEMQAQLKVTPRCDDFYVDILDGKVNGVKPDFTMGQIKQKLPCFTSSDSSGISSSKCGGTVFYKDRDVYFYADRNYVEIGEKFKGKLSIPLLGAPRNGLFKWLGNPKLKDINWDAFEMAYGILVLHYNKAGKVSLIQFSTKNEETLNLCE